MEGEVTSQTVSRGTLSLALFVALCLVALLAPGAEARPPPKRSGPLNFDERRCSRAIEEWRNPKTGRMETVARSKTCVLFYTYDPLAEDDEERDFGVVWVQSRVKPRNGWCARRVASDLFVSKDTKIHTTRPKKTQGTGSSRQLRVKLGTDANGAGAKTGTVSEIIKIFPKKLRHSTTTTDTSRVFRQRWSGLRGKPLNFASGAEVSWAIDDPPDALTSGLTYRFEKRGTCK